MSSQMRSAALRYAAVVALATVVLSDYAHAQGIPNPLVRPQRGAETVPVQQGQAAAPAASQRGATAAPAGRAAAAAGRGGEGLPAEDRDEAKTVAELLAGLYVSTVIGDRAVLRSLDVRTVPGLASNLGAAVGVGAGGAGAAAGGGGGSGSNTGIAGLRSQVYIVRNGEVMSLVDRLRVLVRVRDTTVTLFDVTDIPPGQYDPLDLMDRGFPVAFRGSVDSMQSLPPTPGILIRPGEGVDGEAFQRARNTSGGTSGGGSSNTRSNTGGGGGGLGNP